MTKIHRCNGSANDYNGEAKFSQLSDRVRDG
jgi:hypothetical protein